MSSVTIAFDPAKMAEAKALIKNFRRQFGELMESGKKKEVYHLQIGFIPLTKGDVI